LTSGGKEAILVGRDVYISGIGSYSPGNPVPFDRIEDVLGRITDATPKLLKRIDRIRPIMKEMLGIEYSYYAIDPETRQTTDTNVSMCVKAAGPALEKAGVLPTDVELIIYAGILYDCMCPPSSVLVQDALKIPYCAEMSIHSNCTAIYKAIQVASDLISIGRYNNALIVTSQLSSTFFRSEYYNQKVLTEEQAILRWFLSDGAGALVLTHNKPDSGCLKVVDTYLESVGMGIEPSMRMEFGAVKWKIADIYENGWHHLTQDIKTVTRLAPVLFEKGIKAMLAKMQLDVSTVKCFFANIPTKHMMDVAIKKLRKNDFKNPDLVFYTKLATRGYQGAPAIIIALDDYMIAPPLQRGDRIISFVTESSKWMHAGFVLEYC
jgi:3-oxoacyl-[acyl-carrier-protein] synthase III